MYKLTCYLNRSKYVAFRPLSFRTSASLVKLSMCVLASYAMHAQLASATYVVPHCAYYRTIAHAHVLIGHPGFPIMAMGLWHGWLRCFFLNTASYLFHLPRAVQNYKFFHKLYVYITVVSCLFTGLEPLYSMSPLQVSWWRTY